MESAALGQELAAKWGAAARLHAARVTDAASLAPGAGMYSPPGCHLCTPFGKFCEEAVSRAAAGTLHPAPYTLHHAAEGGASVGRTSETRGCVVLSD